MSYRTPVSVAILCALTSLSPPAHAQTPAGKYYPAAHESNAKKTTSKRPASAPLAEWQRRSAISMIMSLADEADAFKNEALRVRVQARAADALWESDSGLAITLFHRAWNTAEKIDEDGQRAIEEARKPSATSRRGLTFIPAAPNLRSEVLQLAARRDPQLGESLLARLDETKEEKEAAESGVTNGDELSFFDPTEPPLATAKRLELATDLVKAGEVERAKVFADRGLNYATSQGIIFLSTLRQRDAKAADERYARLLSLAATDTTADATTVSLLSSYVFTPNLLVTATRRGRVSNQLSEAAPAAEPSEELRREFLRVGAQILLRPMPPPDQDRTSAGRSGTYFTIARLLPLFEQYASDQHTALSQRLAVLAPDTLESYKNNDNGMQRAGLEPESSSRDDLSVLLSQLSTVTGSDERDLLYVKAVKAASLKGDGRIREFADQITNAGLKKHARSFADFVAVRKALDEKDVEGGVRIIGEGNLPPIQRIWAYVEGARVLKTSDSSRALQLLTGAAEEARKIDGGGPERIYAFTCIAAQFFHLDRARAWEMTAEVVKAANGITDFAADDGKLTAQLHAKDVAAMITLEVPSFNITGLFELLAGDEIHRASQVANGLQGEAARATANLAIARSLLRKQPVD